MDKLKMYTVHRTAIPMHIKEKYFQFVKPILINDVIIDIYMDYEAGVCLKYLPKGITLECNPTKFVCGNNNTMIDRNGLVQFIELFNERYQVEIGLWQVSGFDYNSDIEVDHSPASYLSCMGDCKKWLKHPYPTTLTFATASNTKGTTLYDLNERCTANGEAPVITPPRILRIEASQNKNLRTLKDLKEMQTLNDYTQPENYRQLPRIWLNHYQMITKNEAATFFDSLPQLTPKEHIMLLQIRQYTANGYKAKVKLDKPTNYRYTFQKVDNLMNKIKAHRHQQGLTSLVDELDQKVLTRYQELILAASGEHLLPHE